MYDSSRREEEWNSNARDVRFIMQLCGSRAAEMTMEVNGGGGNGSAFV